jgi:Zn-dependent protease with chaperone function
VNGFKNRGQKRLRAIGTVCGLALMASSNGWAQLKTMRPGWNLFSVQQDVQIGREAANELSRQVPIVHNRELDDYLNAILRKLAQSSYARTLNRDGSRSPMFPFTIHAVYDKNINAFSLPGGPIFVNTAVIDVAENEAQLAGVIAHEMSHIVLRHSTNQASKRNLVALPAMLAGALAGRSLLGQLAQIGIGFSANSVLLKFSRTDEAEADYNGAQMLADARYNPLELARFFEILEAKTRSDRMPQFLSDHPNPGNRVAAVSEEIRQLPRRDYVEEQTGLFARTQGLVRHLPNAGRSRAAEAGGGRLPLPTNARPSNRLRLFRGETFSLSYPENWQFFSELRANSATIAPPEGVVRGANGQTLVSYGLELSYFSPESGPSELERDTQALISRLKQSTAGLRIVRDGRRILVADQPALLTTLNSQSPYRGEQEVDALVTVVRPEGLFYMIFIAPESEFGAIQSTFEDVLRSVRFR